MQSSNLCFKNQFQMSSEPLFDDISFSPFSDSAFDILQDPIFDNPENEISTIAPTRLENLSNSPEPNSGNDFNFETQFSDFYNLEVKTEGFQSPIHSASDYQSFGPHSYGGAENVERFMQRSHSNSSFNSNRGFLFHPNFEFVLKNLNLENLIMSSPESSLGSGQMRRVCSTGDLQVTEGQGNHGLCSGSPLGVESSFIEQANFKVGRYSAEERKERIHRYRAKRNLRNFNKTIKYTCRKTLADNRPRIRGRFARNDEIPKTASLNPYKDEDDPWVDGYNEEERRVKGGTIFNIMGPTEFQYYGFS